MVSKEKLVQFLRDALKRPSVIALFAFIVIAEGMLNNGEMLKTVSPTFRWAVITAFGIVTWLTFYILLPHFLWILTSHNIPFSVGVAIICVLASVELVMSFVVLLGHLQPVSVIVIEFMKLLLLSLIAGIIYLSSSHESDISILTANGRVFPYWRPVPAEKLKQRNEAPEMFDANVVMMKSFNQYVELHSPTAKRDARMSLTKAASYFDDNIGTRVHRSYWVRNNKMICLFYKNGNPFLEIEGELSVPVGRNMVDKVKALIEET
jgi:hypothetical protein